MVIINTINCILAEGCMDYKRRSIICNDYV